MLNRSDYPIADALALLARHGVDAALLVPTANGIEKSIMDATGALRDYLENRGYHDFNQQGQGSEHKVTRLVHFVRPSSLVASTASFYRPNTKSGDPRVWLGSATRENAAAFNLLALTVLGGQLYVLNMSDATVRASLGDASSPFRKIVDSLREAVPVVDELLSRLRKVGSRGFIRTGRAGDTGVGMTLETELGIAANSNRAPDYKGIELKSARHRLGSGTNRSTLFSKVPNWHLSPVRSAVGLLDRRGYVDKDTGRLQLYHTVHGNRVNSLGLMLDIDGGNDWLRQLYVSPEGQSKEHDVTWVLNDLRNDLSAKHRETFWIKAACRGTGSDEEFHYVEARHTRAPMVRNFAALVEAGIITVDYLLHKKEKGVRDHGYLFKIHPSNMDALFPPSELHALA